MGEYEAEGGIEDHGGLDAQALAKVRNEEIAHMEQIGVWEAATVEECWMKTGRGPISTRQVDIDKGRD